MPVVTGIGLASVTNVPNLFPTLPSVASASASSVATPVSSAVSVTAQSSTVDSQTPTATKGVNAVNTSPAAANAGTSFFQNKAALIGVCAGAGVLLIVLLASLTACIRRRNRRRERERQRKLDREISVSYRTTMKQAAESWRPPPSLNQSMPRSRANSMYSTVSESSGSHGAYAQPPLPVTQQPPNYEAAPRQRGNEAWRATMAVVDVAVRGTMVEPHIVQPQRAQMYPAGPAQSDSRAAQRPSQSADIHLPVPPQAPPAIYLSHSALSPPPADAAAPPYTSPAAEMPLTPTPLPNPFDQQQQQRGRERPTSDIPITPTPFPNPFDRQLQAKQVLTTPVSPAPWLPNPYAADE
ncbi:hypothetical protein B0H12DRAFT_284702 [Mycena haematopus]|nr:hypothetical protein B0H12DRAFT_284702 [Mycena haematopus]